MSENNPEQQSAPGPYQPPAYQQPPAFQPPAPGSYPSEQPFAAGYPVRQAYPGGYPMAPAQDPGKTMGIIALVLPFVGFGLVGLILGLVAMSKSKKAGFKNTPALIGVIVSILAIIATIIIGIFIGIGVNQVLEICRELGPGVQEYKGTTITCPAL
ncbi:DUF4190 domain-containing protein [Pseudarthrobacter sp. P1]|uniref:DUF4190 domain-containing protein n=1 Tax=Pseudarthrobacter sp. P1 TaxID=3418418 RepID=UPI003CE69265